MRDDAQHYSPKLATLPPPISKTLAKMFGAARTDRKDDSPHGHVVAGDGCVSFGSCVLVAAVDASMSFRGDWRRHLLLLMRASFKAMLALGLAYWMFG